ncbi:MAG: AAA family ATPase [Gammaproteobacteria bacterium]|nr:AAA family ATPase [Gammaproteobacteria bacterium]
MTHPLNTILYGPPGTGKTYATFRRCVEICDQPGEGLTPARIHARYSELVEEGRVEFITFHQSYGYEEFVEGLRPETEGDGGGFRLAVRDGVLKRISKRARSAPSAQRGKRRFFKVALNDPEVLQECMEDGCVRCEWPGDEDWSSPTYDEFGTVMNRIGERWGKDARRWHAASSTEQFRSLMSQGDIVVVPEGNQRYRAVGEVVGDYSYDPRSSGHPWPHRRAVHWHREAVANARPVEDFQDRYFASHPIHWMSPDRPEALLKYLGKKSNPQSYVLVIDEINRANVAKVLGELITLLEEDKREGAENELAVTLPHSNEPFTLPSNLHLLGTMNTADRSIALLDTALRRRFVFEEITPDPSLLEEAGKDTGVDLPAVLQAMNERLEWLRGRDHLIGHAWFRATESREAVDEVMRRKVIPLIAEYFYDDWEKVQAVLGGTDAFVQREKLEPPPGLEGESETRYRWTVRDPFPEDAYEALVAGRGP